MYLWLCSFCRLNLDPAHHDSGNLGFASVRHWSEKTFKKHTGTQWNLLNKHRQERKMKKIKKRKKKSSHLHHAADNLGEHVERKPEDVEEWERHKGLLRVQDVILIHGHIHGKCCQGNLGNTAANRALTHINIWVNQCFINDRSINSWWYSPHYRDFNHWYTHK